MRLTLVAALDRLRSSLFFLPMAAVVAAIILGSAGVWFDRTLDDPTTNVPFVFTSTVRSARATLAAIAAATISFAGVAFSIALLVIQLTSSQYSPRTVHTLFRDPFNRRVMALVVGTFTYCVIVLRAVRGPLEDSGDAVIPNLSVAIAVVLGLASILATVAFIDHSAHTMDVSQVLRRAARAATDHVQRTWTDEPRGDDQAGDPTSASAPADARTPSAPACTIRFAHSGWVQHLDLDTLTSMVPEGGTIELVTYPGRYGVVGAPMCRVRGEVPDADDLEHHVRRSVGQGTSRTIDQDASYGLRQIIDVGLRALSPGVNDPTTAQDAIWQATGVLIEMLSRHPPPKIRTTENGGTLLLTAAPTHDDMIDLTFDELRRAAAPHPTVCRYLIDAMATVREALEARGLGDRGQRLTRHAAALVEGVARSDALPDDLDEVRRRFDAHFATSRPA